MKIIATRNRSLLNVKPDLAFWFFFLNQKLLNHFKNNPKLVIVFLFYFFDLLSEISI